MAKTELQEYGESVIMLNLVFYQHKYEATKAIIEKHLDTLSPLFKAELEECVKNIESQKQEMLDNIKQKKNKVT
ncbi:hypothetical protein OA493_03390 [Gammaproteobacteria bacterium]|nr:hypothetical protein [Gammaproteobacteria bacterium]